MGFCTHSLPSLLLLPTLLFYLTGAQPELRQARHLDSLLRNIAFMSYDHSDRPKTGQLFPLNLPTNLSHAASATTVRYRSGSLHRYGARIREFLIAPGATIQPYVERLVVVRQRLDNSSSGYYRVSGYRFLSPVLGLLFYNGDEINATDPSELQFSATKRPILIDFSNLTQSIPAGVVPVCAFWDLHGNVRLMELAGGGGFASARICLGYKEGHYGLLLAEVKVTMTSRKWKIVVASVVGGAMGALLLGLLLVALVKKKNKKLKMAEMERRAYQEEALQVSMVGHVLAPVASGVRTLPVLENGYVP